MLWSREPTSVAYITHPHIIKTNGRLYTIASVSIPPKTRVFEYKNFAWILSVGNLKKAQRENTHGFFHS